MHVDQPIVFLTSGGLNPIVVTNAIANRFSNVHVVFERPESKLTILKRRRRHCGALPAVGQLATMIVSRLGKRFTQQRSEMIIKQFGLQTDLLPTITQHHIGNINDDQCVSLVRELNPSVVVTVSSRLLKKATLQNITPPVINLHAGINPAYRGQMGGYWSLVENDVHNFGATIHLVDAGVDTGATLYETRMKPDVKDSISTYPLLLSAASIDNLINAIEDVLSGSLSPKPPIARPSKLRFPPPIWTWIWNGLTKRIW